MDLFRRAGKTFERTKQSFLEGKDADYVCTSCEEPVAEAADTCPHCGAATVEPVD